MANYQLILLLTAICFAVTLAAEFDYSSSSGKGPDKWPSLFSNYCSKSSQSPVNIVVKGATYHSNLMAIYFKNYETTPSGTTMDIANNGHSFSVTVKPNTFSISGGELPGTYNLHSFHFHWGSASDRGSEHTIDGKASPAEMHLVHFNNKYGNLNNSLNYKDGLAVLGVLFNEGGSDNEAFQSFLKYTKDVIEPKTIYNLTQTHSLSKLLPTNKHDYYRYNGSLTTPKCNEVVTWTVFRDYVNISTAQLNLLRSLKENNVALVNNYRPVQELNGRVIQTSFRTPENGARHVTNTLTTIAVVVIAVVMSYCIH